MTKTVLMTYTQKMEYRVSITSTEDLGRAIERAAQYLATGNTIGLDVGSIRFTIEED